MAILRLLKGLFRLVWLLVKTAAVLVGFVVVAFFGAVIYQSIKIAIEDYQAGTSEEEIIQEARAPTPESAPNSPAPAEASSEMSTFDTIVTALKRAVGDDSHSVTGPWTLPYKTRAEAQAKVAERADIYQELAVRKEAYRQKAEIVNWSLDRIEVRQEPGTAPFSYSASAIVEATLVPLPERQESMPVGAAQDNLKAQLAARQDTDTALRDAGSQDALAAALASRNSAPAPDKRTETDDSRRSPFYLENLKARVEQGEANERRFKSQELDRLGDEVRSSRAAEDIKAMRQLYADNGRTFSTKIPKGDLRPRMLPAANPDPGSGLNYFTYSCRRYDRPRGSHSRKIVEILTSNIIVTKSDSNYRSGYAEREFLTDFEYRPDPNELVLVAEDPYMDCGNQVNPAPAVPHDPIYVRSDGYKWAGVLGYHFAGIGTLKAKITIIAGASDPRIMNRESVIGEIPLSAVLKRFCAGWQEDARRKIRQNDWLRREFEGAACWEW